MSTPVAAAASGSGTAVPTRKRRAAPRRAAQTEEEADGGDESAAAAAAASSAASSSGAAVTAAPAGPGDGGSLAAQARRPPARAVAPDTSLLPHTYQHVIAFFPRVFALASLFWHRGSPCTFDSLTGSLGPLFAFSHLRQMVFLCPSMLQLQPLLLNEEKDDPFAPVVQVHRLPLTAQYELLSTPLQQRATASASASAARTAADHNPDQPVRFTTGERNAITRPKGPKPTPQSVAEALVAFKQLVVAHFARPDSSLSIPECALPPHADPALQGLQGRLATVPPKSALIDSLTVADAEDDATTRPRCAASFVVPGEPNGLANLLAPPNAAAAAIPAAGSTSAAAADNDSDDEVQIIERPGPASSRINGHRSIKQEGSASASAASSSSAAAAADPAQAQPAGSPIDPYPHISSPLFHNLLAHLKQQKFWQGQIVHVHHVPARGAITVEIGERGAPVARAVGAAANVGIAASAASSSSFSSSVATPATSSDGVDRASALLGLFPSAPVLLSPRIRAALGSLVPPIRRLFVHQSQAINALLVERVPAVVVATATSSGKSLCYSIPIVEMLTNGSTGGGGGGVGTGGRALCLFPTKALAQDQLRSLRSFIQAVGGSHLVVDTYDGDTPSAARAALRERCGVLLSNPDMLHCSMLPHHGEMSSFFRQLRFVVLDEAHTYRGVFGAHVCLVLRRLRRVCAFYGSSPQFVACSATISNPLDFVSRLLGMPAERVRLVEEDGSARGEKQFLLYNPPLVPTNETDKQVRQTFSHRAFEYAPFMALSSSTTRRSSHMETAMLLANMVQINYRSICFTHSRKVAELVTSWVHEILAGTPSTRNMVPLVKTYRGGYGAAERRQIEHELFSGKLRGVVATNALELGIDIGTLDATIHLGLPPSMSSLLQQAGRSGRGTRPSLSILVAHDSPLDQYYICNPAKLFARRAEAAIVDFESPYLMRSHLMCAAVELPLTPHTDAALFGPRFLSVLSELRDVKFWVARRPIDPRIASPFDAHPCFELVNGTWEREFLTQHGLASGGGGGRGVNTDAGPAACFSIRSASNNVYHICDATTGAIIDETEQRRAMFDLHEGAIYTNQGREFLVQSVDNKGRSIRVKPVGSGGSKYFTKCVDRKWTTVMSRMHAFATSELAAAASVSAAGGTEEEEEEQKIPESLSASLTAMHSALSASLQQRQHHGPNNLARSRGLTRGRDRTDESGSDPAWSVLPYTPPSAACWYIKTETPLTWRELCAYGKVCVATTVFGFRKISKLTSKVIDRQDLHMPLHEFDTYACWIDVPFSIQHAYARHVEGGPERDEHEGSGMEAAAVTAAAAAAATSRPRKRVKTEGRGAVAASSSSISLAPPSATSASSAASAASSPSPSPVVDGAPSLVDRNVAQAHSIHAGLHGLTHCMIALMPMYLLCDGPNDLRCDCPSVYERSYEERSARPARVLMYESVASAGPAFVRASARVLHLVVSHARQVIESCPCTGVQGCPSCVQSSRCTELNEVTDKRAALWIATAMEQWSREYPLPN